MSIYTSSMSATDSSTRSVPVLRALQKKFTSHRSAPIEIRDQVEVVPHQTFETFLADKANKGFSFKDKLKYRGIELLNARGIKNNIRAFFSLGAIGYFVRGKVSESNRQALTQEAHFYRTCCNVQDVFGKFKQKPDANFAGLKEAYELILKVANNNGSHDEINMILDNLCKASVGGDLLDFEAISALQSRGGFNEASVLSTINGQAFLEDIDAKREAGYRGRPLEDKEEAVLRMNGQVIQQTEIKDILGDQAARSIFQSYARAYTKLRDQEVNGQPNGVIMSMDLISALSSKNVSEGLVQSEIDHQNKLILELVQKPAEQVTAAAIPVGCEDRVAFVEELDRVSEHYANYHASLDAQAAIPSQLAIAQRALTKAEAALEKESAKTRTCTFAEMEKIYGPIVNQRLPGANAFAPIKAERNRITDALEAKNGEIADEIATLEGLVGNEGSLLREQEELEQTLAVQDELISKHLEDVDGFDRDVKTFVKGIKKGNEQDADVLEKIRQSAETLRAARAAHSKTAQKLAEKVGEITDARANLRFLKTNSKIHPLIADKISLEQQLAVCLKTTFTLTHGEIKELHDGGFTNNHPSDFEVIAGQVGQLDREATACTSELGRLQGDLERNESGLEESQEVLRRFGFQFKPNGQVGGFKHKHFNEGYQQTMREHLKQQGPLTANILNAFQLTTMDIKDVNNQSIMNLNANAPVEIAEAAPVQEIPARRNTVNLVQEQGYFVESEESDDVSSYEGSEAGMNRGRRPRFIDASGFIAVDLD